MWELEGNSWSSQFTPSYSFPFLPPFQTRSPWNPATKPFRIELQPSWSERDAGIVSVSMSHASSCTLSSPSITLLFIRLINKACYPRYALIGWKVDWHGIGDRYFNHVRARTRSCRDGEKERRKDRDKKREERVTIVRGRIHGRERRRKEKRKTNSFHEFHRLIPSMVAPRGSL